MKEGDKINKYRQNDADVYSLLKQTKQETQEHVDHLATNFKGQ